MLKRETFDPSIYDRFTVGGTFNYIENNSENRQLFLDLGYSEDDLSKFQSLLFSIPSNSSNTLKYDAKGRPIGFTHEELIFTCGLDESPDVPLGLCHGKNPNDMDLDKVSFNRLGYSYVRVIKYVDTGNCKSKCDRHYKSDFCQQCYGDVKKDIIALSKFFFYFSSIRIPLDAMFKVSSRIEPFDSSNKVHLSIVMNDYDSKLKRIESLENIMIKAKQAYKQGIADSNMDVDDLSYNLENMRAKWKKLQEQEEKEKMAKNRVEQKQRAINAYEAQEKKVAEMKRLMEKQIEEETAKLKDLAQVIIKADEAILAASTKTEEDIQGCPEIIGNTK